ncbi:MAG: succinate dehydrogenase [Blastocatellia bacterium]
MASNLVQITRRGFGETMRRDAWWVQSLLTVLGFAAFVVYSTWAAFQGNHYTFGPYLSPMYSPEIFGASPHAIFGPMPSWIPTWLPLTPAFLILWAPGGFRFTCYYYRGAYYKAFWAAPIACSVGEPRSGYRGENWFPLILQNVHRYFLYIALFFIVFLSYDVWNAMWFADGWGIGVGTIVLTINVILLGSYTLGCHSLRHLIGGARDVLSGRPIQKKAYDCVSVLNKSHMMFAWFSLFWVGFTDFYIRACSMGLITDYRLL